MKNAAVAAIRFYQRNMSGLKRMPTCRFVPTCSEYAAQAIERHGIFIGGALALRRVARCNPFGGSGYDPVPERAYRKEKK